jgi:hypothetical protein
MGPNYKQLKDKDDTFSPDNKISDRCSQVKFKDKFNVKHDVIFYAIWQRKLSQVKRRNLTWSTDNPGESEVGSMEGWEQTVDYIP